MPELDPLIQIEQEHDLVGPTAIGAVDTCDRAAVLPWGDVADPGQRTAHPVAAWHPLCAQQHRLDAGHGLHRVGQGGTAEATAFDVIAQASQQSGVLRLLHVQAADVMAPGEKTGGATAAGDLAGSCQRKPKVGPAPVQMRAERAHLGEARHDVQRVVTLPVDTAGGLGERPAGYLGYSLEHGFVVRAGC